MKYILICILALIFIFAIGAVIVFIINKVKKKPLSRISSILLTVLFGVCIFIMVSMGYLSIYYHAEEGALNEVFTNPNINSPAVIPGGFFIDGDGEKTALILYPGAKVESESYFYFASILAENGIDVFVADFPFNIAFFKPNAADQFIKNEYDNWIIAGHSMGGVLACNYANNHPELFTNVVLLASYPTSPIKDEISLLSVYGDMDGCLGMDVYEESKKYWPANSKELCIEGGNHAQFANYGEQKSDGKASISSLEQKEMTVNEILEFIEQKIDQKLGTDR